MFWNTVTGSVIGLIVAGAAYALTGRHYAGDSRLGDRSAKSSERTDR